MIDTCIKHNIPFEVEQEVLNGSKRKRTITFSYQNDKIFPISKNINKIQKRLAEKECEEM